MTNAAFGKNPDGAAALESLNRGANGFAIRTMSIRRDGVDRAQKSSDDWVRKKFRHRHPIDFSPNDRRNDERIEMADVIGGEEKCAGAFGVFTTQDVDARDAAEKRPHEFGRRKICSAMK
jgi:hypothetical protein